MESPSPPAAAAPTAASVQWEIHICNPEDTLAGIALSRNVTIREIKSANKLWSDTLWPGQKLRVPKRKEKSEGERERASTAGKTARQQSAKSMKGGPPAPLLVRLRDLFDQQDTLYSQHVNSRMKVPHRLSVNSSRRHLSAIPQLKVASKSQEGFDEDAAGDEEERRVITINAVLLRLHPFLAVKGSMTLTGTRLMFLPDHQDPQVRKLGVTMLQVDVPSVNITGVKRVKPDDLDMLILEDVRLSLQDDQRFLEVLYKMDAANIVAVRDLERKGLSRRRKASDTASLHFMLSPESLSLVRTKLVQRIGKSGSASGGLPVLVREGVPGAPIPELLDLLQLQPYIPLMFRSCTHWFLRFCSKVDGLSMTTLMSRVYDVAPLLFFVRTETGERFGVYVGDELAYGKEFYGSDRTFVFRLDSFGVWTAQHKGGRYFLLLNEEGLSVGGDSQGRVSFFLHKELTYGETQTSSAFDNEPLVMSDFKFTIAVLEIYSFEPPEGGDTPRSGLSSREL